MMKNEPAELHKFGRKFAGPMQQQQSGQNENAREREGEREKGERDSAKRRKIWREGEIMRRCMRICGSVPLNFAKLPPWESKLRSGEERRRGGCTRARVQQCRCSKL